MIAALNGAGFCLGFGRMRFSPAAPDALLDFGPTQTRRRSCSVGGSTRPPSDFDRSATPACPRRVVTATVPARTGQAGCRPGQAWPPSSRRSRRRSRRHRSRKEEASQSGRPHGPWREPGRLPRQASRPGRSGSHCLAESFALAVSVDGGGFFTALAAEQAGYRGRPCWRRSGLPSQTATAIQSWPSARSGAAFGVSIRTCRVHRPLCTRKPTLLIPPCLIRYHKGVA